MLTAAWLDGVRDDATAYAHRWVALAFAFEIEPHVADGELRCGWLLDEQHEERAARAGQLSADLNSSGHRAAVLKLLEQRQ